ncbi:MAG: hypothetical protein NHB32_15235 [Fischerella sp. CENA71]|nr:hypothetical protein [Fischerella sp. CENA71]
MTPPFKGKVEFLNSNDQLVLTIDPDSTFEQIIYGPNQTNPKGVPVLTLTNTASLSLYNTVLDGTTATLYLKGNGHSGDVRLFSDNGKDTFFLTGGSGSKGSSMTFRNTNEQPTIALDGSAADLTLGGGNQGGTITLRNGAYQDTMVLDGTNANIRLGGGNTTAGNIALYPGNATAADLSNFNNANIHLNGQTGDILLKNADCAEEFDISGLEDIEPGTVMVIDSEGKLQPSTVAYDRKVAGVISGAGEYKPGIVLDKKQSQHKRMPVALMGKVYCKVDAQYSPIEVGDLLTTSPTPGYAMKADDPAKAFGAVIGKALRPLKEGNSLIPVLIALQ